MELSGTTREHYDRVTVIFMDMHTGQPARVTVSNLSRGPHTLLRDMTVLPGMTAARAEDIARVLLGGPSLPTESIFL